MRGFSHALRTTRSSLRRIRGSSPAIPDRDIAGSFPIGNLQMPSLLLLSRLFASPLGRWEVTVGSCSGRPIAVQCYPCLSSDRVMFRSLSLGVVFMASALAQAHPPQILEVYREYLKPSAVQAVHKIEVDAAQICIRLKFPHRYLVLESLAGPKEFWYLNAFDSQVDMDEVNREYEGNKALTSALAENLKRKAAYLAAESTNVFLNYRPELSE